MNLCILCLLIAGLIPTIDANFCSTLSDDFYPYPGNCKRYYKCVNHVTTAHECRGEQLFDPVLGVCDEPDYVNCTGVKSTETLAPETCTSLICETGKILARVLHPTKCVTEIYCHDSAKGAYQCPTGTESVGMPQAPMCKPTDPDACTVTGAKPYSKFCLEKADGTYPNPKDCNSYFTCTNKVTKFIKCDDGKAFDMHKNTCSDASGFNCTTCGDNVLSLPHEECPLWGCCNGTFYHKEKSVCLKCSSEIKVVSQDDQPYFLCHNGKMYDDRIHFLKTCETTIELRLRKEMDDLECCGKTIFHVSNHTCRTCGKTKKLYTKVDAVHYHCCKDTIFDTRLKKCRVCETTEKLFDISVSDNYQCCGSQFFDIRNYRCKSCGTRDEIYHKDVAGDIHCCKDHLYNIKEKVCKHCCAGGESNAFDRSIADYMLCCGDSFFDRRTHECKQCGVESQYFVPSDAVHMDCCGGMLFDTRIEMCRRCKDQFAFFNKNVAHNYYCCGDEFYNALQSECKICSPTSYTIISDNDVDKFGCCAGKYFENSFKNCVTCNNVELLKAKHDGNGDPINWKCCGSVAIESAKTCPA